jgi:hypothetical protein
MIRFLMSKHTAQLDPGKVTTTSPMVEARLGFFFFTADSERVLT